MCTHTCTPICPRMFPLPSPVPCPYSIAHTPLPMLHCPCSIAFTLLPMLYPPPRPCCVQVRVSHVGVTPSEWGGAAVCTPLHPLVLLLLQHPVFPCSPVQPPHCVDPSVPGYTKPNRCNVTQYPGSRSARCSVSHMCCMPPCPGARQSIILPWLAPVLSCGVLLCRACSPPARAPK